MVTSEYIDSEALRSMLLGMFEFSPIAMAITTAGRPDSRYVKVNAAFLKLTGRSWDEIAGQTTLEDSTAVDEEGRRRRSRLLDETGHYTLEEVSLGHAGGSTIPTLVSAQRWVIDGRTYHIEIIIDISSRVMMQQELERHLTNAAMTDALTALPNRAHFDKYFHEAVANARAAERTVALAFLDLNGFKAVNDRYGHAIGDQALRKVAERLRARCRPTDFVARIGGDEFAIVYHVAGADAGRLATRLRGSLKDAFAPVGIDGAEFEIGAAVGLAFLNSPDETALSLLKLADRQMYQAKASGERVAIRVAPYCGPVQMTA